MTSYEIQVFFRSKTGFRHLDSQASPNVVPAVASWADFGEDSGPQDLVGSPVGQDGDRAGQDAHTAPVAAAEGRCRAVVGTLLPAVEYEPSGSVGVRAVFGLSPSNMALARSSPGLPRVRFDIPAH